MVFYDDNLLSRAQKAHRSGDLVNAFYLYICCKESKRYLEDDTFRTTVNDAEKQLLQRRGRRAGYIMPRPAGAISAEDLYQVAKMIQTSDMFSADRKKLLANMYLDGCAEMGCVSAQYEQAVRYANEGKYRAAIGYCEKAAAQGNEQAMALLPTLKAKCPYLEWELNEENVQRIFENCLATTESKDITGFILFKKENGFAEDSKPIPFDRQALKENEKAIKFLYGQIQDIYVPNTFITPNSVTKNYMGKVWTENKSIILKFLNIGHAVHLFKGFCKVESTVGAIIFPFSLTRSPNDPSFSEWWETHKAEWEEC